MINICDLELDDTEIAKQMINYCNSIQNYSYYELMFYAADNRPDWADVLRKKGPRSCIAEYLQSARRECRAKGIKKPTLYESMSYHKNI